jgi:hypothetical protein
MMKAGRNRQNLEGFAFAEQPLLRKDARQPAKEESF